LPDGALGIFVLAISTLGSAGLGVGAAGTAVAKAGHPRACGVLMQGLEGRLSGTTSAIIRTRGSNVLSCEYLDKPGLEYEWRVSFGWVPYRSPAKARQAWQEAWSLVRGEQGVSRLHGHGTDDAYELEKADPEKIDVIIEWVKRVN
jgi:hypothetical protein